MSSAGRAELTSRVVSAPISGRRLSLVGLWNVVVISTLRLVSSETSLDWTPFASRSRRSVAVPLGQVDVGRLLRVHLRPFRTRDGSGTERWKPWWTWAGRAGMMAWAKERAKGGKGKEVGEDGW